MARCISCGAPLAYSMTGGICYSRQCQARDRARELATAAARRQRTAAELIRSERDRTHAARVARV